MNIPSILTAGDTFSWTDSLADYPAPTWKLKYSLWRYGSAAISITATASGTDHVILIAKTTTAGYATGIWNWSAYVEDATTRKTIGTGTVTINPDLSAATVSSDLRSENEIILAALIAAQTGRASLAQESVVINGKQVKYLSPDVLAKQIEIYRVKVSIEQGTFRRKIFTRF